MPATRKKSPARSPIHRVTIRKSAGKKSADDFTGGFKLTPEQRKKVGRVAAADFDKLHNKKQAALVESLSRKLKAAGVSGSDNVKLSFEIRKSLIDQFVAGAAASHTTTMSRVTTAAKARRKERVERHGAIRKEYEKHHKGPKMDALQKTAAMMSCSINTVRRAID
jgi:hypothetical protein